MTNVDVHLQFANNHSTPHGTQVLFRNPGIYNLADISIKLPGSPRFRNIGLLPIVDGVVTIPMKLVFLCHASEDQAAVEAVQERLVNDAVLTWFAPKNLQGGDDWKNRIDEALERADHVLVFLSPASCTKTGYVQREIKYTFEQAELRPDGSKYVIPVLLDSCTPPRRFKDIHWIKLFDADGYERLLRSIADQPL